MNTKDENFIDKFMERESLKGLSVKDLRRKRSHVERFLIFFGKACSKATKEDIRSFLDEMRGKYSASSYNMICCTLQKFFSFLVERELILVDPTLWLDRIKINKENHLGVFTEHEVKRIFQAIPGTKLGIRDSAILELLYSSGMRAGELIGLNVDDVDFIESEVYIRKGKDSSQRIVPIGERALEAVEKYLDIRYKLFGAGGEREALFLSLKGNRVSYTAVSRAVIRYKGIAGVTSEGVLHAFRHSCATHLLKNGAPICLVQKLLGHAYLETTQVYTHITDRDVQSRYREIERKEER